MEDLPIVVSARAAYIHFFRRALAAMRGSDTFVSAELMVLLDEDPERPMPRECRLVRYDFATMTLGRLKPCAVELDALPAHDPVNFDGGDGFAMQILPFFWNHCTIQFNGEIRSWEPVLAWARMWMDEEEAHEVDADGLSNVIHHLSDLMTVDGAYTFIFQVDLGSADTVAFWELLGAMKSAGVSDLVVYSIPPQSDATDAEKEAQNLTAYFACYSTEEHVAASHPITINRAALTHMADHILRAPKDFIGFTDSTGLSVQFIIDRSGKVEVDLPSPGERGSYAKMIDRAEVNGIIESFPERFDYTFIPGLTFTAWK